MPTIPFALLTVAIQDGQTPSQDQTVLDWVVGLDFPLLAGFSETVSVMTNSPMLIGVGAVVMVLLWLLGMTRAALGFAFVGAVVGAVAYGSDFTIGEIVGRSRPLEASSDTSYPSGHVFGSTVLFGTAGFLAVYYKVKKKVLIPFLTLLLALTLAVGFARMFEQAHWLRDEFLNREVFYTLWEVQVLTEQWRQEYNQIRPHSSLGYKPPAPETLLVDKPVPELARLT